ncbi:MAG TPA: gamma carbonic anhydrase family protein [Casimicrobiaceae bacterium]
MTQGLILDYLHFHPDVGAGAHIAERGAVIGRSRVGAHPSFGDYATVRADGENIGIGANAWFGEHATVHIADRVLGTVVGDDVTVGRYAVVHACTLGDGVVVGESSVVMDGASVGAHALIAADSVVPPRKNLAGGCVYAGHPAKAVREIGREELTRLARSLRAGDAPPELRSARLPAWADVVQALPPPSGGPLHTLHGRAPKVGRAYVAPTAIVAGDVVIADEASVFFGCAVSAGDGRIVIGERTNVQDNSILATDRARGDLVLGVGVTIGHNVQLGSGTIGDDALIGMGSRVGDRVVVERGACIGAGAWVEPGTVVPAGWIWAGRPARAFRELKAAERDEFARARDIYVEYSSDYRKRQDAAAATASPRRSSAARPAR